MKVGKIAIIGSGNMGGAIANGVIKSGYLEPSAIFMSDPRPHALDDFGAKGVNTFQNNAEAVKDADLVLFAVKPYLIEEVIKDMKVSITDDKIIVSIAAGVDLSHLEEWIGKEKKIVRVMPNTAIAIQESMTCITANEAATEYLDMVKDLFDQLGETVVIPEKMMAAATVLASCGTAYALRYARASMLGGIEMGFTAEMAKFMTAQTVKGAVQLLMESNTHPESEIDKVSTPGGITIKGLNEMEHQGFSSAVIQGLIAAYDKVR